MSSTPPARHCGLLSVVVPCFNEEAVIRQTHRRLTTGLGEASDLSFEIVYVDDGSRDATLDILRELHDGDARVRVISLSRNFGKEAAVVAGLATAKGDAVALIDADLQDPPEALLRMLGRWREGVDVAYGVRPVREGETVFKRWPSRAFYWLFNLLSDVSVPPDTGDFRLMDRKVVDAFLAMPERDRFTPGLVAWTGFRQEPVHFVRAARAAGETKWPVGKLIRLAIDGILSFSYQPLRLSVWLGLLSSCLALLGIVYIFVVRLTSDEWILGYASLYISVLFLGGAQFVLIGILGEYVGRLYMEAKRRPLYIVKERLE